MLSKWVQERNTIIQDLKASEERKWDKFLFQRYFNKEGKDIIDWVEEVERRETWGEIKNHWTEDDRKKRAVTDVEEKAKIMSALFSAGIVTGRPWKKEEKPSEPLENVKLIESMLYMNDVFPIDPDADADLFEWLMETMFR